MARGLLAWRLRRFRGVVIAALRSCAAVGVSGTASKLRAMQLAIIIESPLLFEPPRLPNTRAFIRRIEALERAP